MVKVATNAQPAADGTGLVCFKVTATTGLPNLRVPGVYEIRDDGQKTGTSHTRENCRDGVHGTRPLAYPLGATQRFTRTGS